MKAHFFFFFFVLLLFPLIGPAAAVVDCPWTDLFRSLSSSGLGRFDPSAVSTFDEARATKLDNFQIQGHTYFRIPDDEGKVRTYLCSVVTLMQISIRPNKAYSVTAVDISSNSDEIKDLVILTITTPWGVEKDKLLKQRLGILRTSKTVATLSGEREVLVLDTITRGLVQDILPRFKSWGNSEDDVKIKFKNFLSTLATQFVAPLLRRGISVKNVKLEDIAFVYDRSSNSETFHLRNPDRAELIQDGEIVDGIVTSAVFQWFSGIYDFALRNQMGVLADLVTSGSRQRAEYSNEVYGMVKNLMREDDVERAERKRDDLMEEKPDTDMKDPIDQKCWRFDDIMKYKQPLKPVDCEIVKSPMPKVDVERAKRKWDDLMEEEADTDIKDPIDQMCRRLENRLKYRQPLKPVDCEIVKSLMPKVDVERAKRKWDDFMEEEADKDIKDHIDQICWRLENRLKYRQPLKRVERQWKDLNLMDNNLNDICRRLEARLKGKPGVEYVDVEDAIYIKG